MSASLPLSCGRRHGRAFGAPVPLDDLAEATPDPSFCLSFDGQEQPPRVVQMRHYV